MKSLLAVYSHSTPAFAAREAGGKGWNLYRLAKLALPVPAWTVLGISFFQKFAESANLLPAIVGILKDFKSKTCAAGEASRKIEALILAEPFPPAFNPVLEKALSSIGPGPVSVRSSASDEDSGAHSFAGQLSSFLYVQGLDDIKRCIQQCWASAFSERALVYRRENNLPLESIGIGVILQQMIDPEKSGVLFTCDPVAQTLDRFLVSSVYGVGEGLVSGALDADSFWLDAQTGATVREQIAAKSQALRQAGSGRAQPVPVPPEQQRVPSLEAAELKELFRLGKEILEHSSRPQDVEWAIARGKVWLLQTRPVTTLRRELLGPLNLWDNSNIIESYGGLTSPLSFSFALRNYKNVYAQFCELLSVPSSVIKDMDDTLGHMLGSIHGRVYYNLFNWYKLVSILPGFSQNRQFMETMMGVSESLHREIADCIRPHPSWDTPLGFWRKLKTGLRFFGYHFIIQRLVDNFLRDFHKDYLLYRNRDYRQLRGDEIIRIYLEMEKKMLDRWQAPIINDFLCMVHFGLLRQLTTRWLAALDPAIQNDLCAGEGNLESAEPTKALIRLAALAVANPELKTLIESTPPQVALEALQQSAFSEFHRQVLDYIDRFGFRCMNEMKLEETDLYSDASYLFVCLQNYLRAGVINFKTIEAREKQLRLEAEQRVFSYLRGFRKLIYAWVLKHARQAVRNRENTRFARTRIYGVARSMFQALGEDLAARSLLERPRDIFFLTIEEVFGIYQGTLPAPDLQGLADVRKASYAKFEASELKPRFTTRGPVYWNNAFLLNEEPIQAPTPASKPPDESADLAGLPCCPGVVEGIVKVVTSPKDDLNLKGEILAAPRTDPGWVPLYPSISGLLVERGSLLSHSAIVAREMGLPTIVSISGLTKKLKTGMRIRMDGKAGTIRIMDQSG